ncbi:MAG: hypothetical protein IH987_03610 [Planctomycetes bacterium]|nr:hypothetical protein [Planctomycetota bacterium]
MIGTDPTSQDTDGDGLSDSFERLTGWRVLSVVDNTARDVMPSPLFADSDFDGLSDRAEYVGADGIRPGDSGDAGDATDPTDPDTDDDGVLDSEEVAAGTDPLRPDLALNISVRGITLAGQGEAIIGSQLEITAEVVGQSPVVIANNQTFTGCVNDEFSAVPACPDGSAFTIRGGTAGIVNVTDLDGLCSANATLTVRSGETLVIRLRTSVTLCGLGFDFLACLSTSTQAFEFTDLQSSGFISLPNDLSSIGVSGINACTGEVVLELIRETGAGSPQIP